jgi:hypothetical protein
MERGSVERAAFAPKALRRASPKLASIPSSGGGNLFGER